MWNVPPQTPKNGGNAGFYLGFSPDAQADKMRAVESETLMKENRTADALPDAVPSNNNGGMGPASSDIASDAKFVGAPEVATPQFDTGLGQTARAAVSSEKPVHKGLMSRERQNLTILISVVALAMALAAVFRLYNPTDPLPLCSEQPDWNQYNCRAN